VTALTVGTAVLPSGTSAAAASTWFRQPRHVLVRESASQRALEPAGSLSPQPHRPAYRSVFKRQDRDVAPASVLSAMNGVSMI
jgi:hypothetical protein